MPRTMQEIIDKAEALADRFESYIPSPGDERDPHALHSLRDAVAARATAERELAASVSAAREAGYSWATIGTLLGTSGEAARQRYGPVVGR